MEIYGIDHVELYVGDARQSAFYLCTAFGFRLIGQGGPETGLVGQRSVLLSQGGIRLLLTSAVAADHQAAGYVLQHGDGVACIAMGTADARRVFAEAVANGATPLTAPVEYGIGVDRVVTAEIGGFGDVRHRFVQRAAGGSEFLPGAIVGVGAESDPGEDLLSVVDHIAVCVPNGLLRPIVAHYERVFGFRQIFEEYVEVGAQAMDSTVVQSVSEAVTLTLIEPDTTRPAGQIDRFLAAHGGAGVQHLAFRTDDIVDTVRTFESRGARFLRTVDSYYDSLRSRLGEVDLDVTDLRATNVLVDRDHWGQVFQIFTRSVHVRDTYFLELVDRHGAKTFGSGNIKALYEAVQAAEAATPPDPLPSDLVGAGAGASS